MLMTVLAHVSILTTAEMLTSGSSRELEPLSVLLLVSVFYEDGMHGCVQLLRQDVFGGGCQTAIRE